MTDKEIIKALECHAKRRCWDNCPNATEERQRLNRPCSQMIAEDALDLINRQQAEIEDLREIIFTDRTEAIKLLKAEAIKEFAERLKEKGAYNSFNELIIFEDMVDTLVKEMTGGKK